jgi:hypothetical protein
MKELPRRIAQIEEWLAVGVFEIAVVIGDLQFSWDGRGRAPKRENKDGGQAAGSDLVVFHGSFFQARQ